MTSIFKNFIQDSKSGFKKYAQGAFDKTYDEQKWEEVFSKNTVNWQTIETAPKDGTHFLATSKHLNGEIFICKWEDMKQVHSTGTVHHIGWFLVGIPKRYYLGFGPLYMPIDQDDLMPTHWMLLPKPPTATGGE